MSRRPLTARGQSLSPATPRSCACIPSLTVPFLSPCSLRVFRHQNRATAWVLLRAKIHAHRLAIQQEADRETRKTQIPGMDRADKIRTWNYAQDRVTDHRVPINMSNLSTILTGSSLDDLLFAVGEYQMSLRLEALLGGDEYESDG